MVICAVCPPAVQSHRSEGARFVPGIVWLEEGFEAQITGDRHRAEKGGV